MGGKGTAAAVKIAADEFGKLLDRPIEIVSADHQNKPDIGSLIARQWFDEGVQAIFGVPTSDG